MPVSRVKLTQLDSIEAYPSVHVGFEPEDMAPVGAVLIHVQAVNLEDAEAVAQMLRAVADTLLADGLLAGELGTVTGPEDTGGHRPFNPQPRQPGGR